MASEAVKNVLRLVDKKQLMEFKKLDEFKAALNVDPPAAWVKQHPFARGVAYLPIDKVESLLDTFFQEWQVEIKSVSQLAQSICAIVRVHYRDPITQEWRYHDGVGATPLKTDKGTSAASLEHIKSDAVATGAPAAVSYAIKDAAEHLGNIFGKNLNRKDTSGFIGLWSRAKVEEAETEVKHAACGDDTKAYQLAELMVKASPGPVKVDLVVAIDEARKIKTVEEVEAKILELEEQIAERRREPVSDAEEAKAESMAEVRRASAEEHQASARDEALRPWGE